MHVRAYQVLWYSVGVKLWFNTHGLNNLTHAISPEVNEHHSVTVCMCVYVCGGGKGMFVEKK